MLVAIVIIILVLAIAVVGLRFMIPAWKASNLFDREYLFPISDNANLRLGADKSGGSLAALDFSEQATTKSASRPKDL